MPSIFDTRSFQYTTADGVTRRFREFFWPDMRRAAKLLCLIFQDEPWLNFVNIAETPPATPQETSNPASTNSYDALLSVLEILFSPTYCDKPLTRDEIESGQFVSVADIKPLIEIAAGLASLEKKSQPPA